MSQAFDQIARFINAPAPSDSARKMVALLLVDTLAVAAGAHPLEPARLAREHALDFHAATAPANSAPLLFDGRRASIPGAAFAAATQIDNLDGHDGYNPTKGHIGCAVVPALLAFADAQPQLTSRKALDLLVMSYEVGARAAIALHRTVTEYHTSGAWNALAVAALGCRMRGATTEQLRHALGIAEYHGPRSQMMREIANPTMLHDGSGMGALTGCMAALLALRGFTGAPAVTLEDAGVADIWSDLGTLWTIELNYIKPYPVCRWAHAPLDGVSALMRAHDLSAGQISAVELRTFRESAALFAGVPKTTGQAQYSLGFAVAAMIVRGQVGPAEISGDGLRDAEVAAFLPRITVTEAAEHSLRFPARRCADVTLVLKDGRRLHSGDVEARGGPEAPLSRAEQQAKAMRFAAPVLGGARAQMLWDMQEKMTTPGHLFRDLCALVTEPPAPSGSRAP